jgi:hypothetical protein
MTDKFKVADLAAAKRRRAPRRSAEPVTVKRVNPDAVRLAHDLARGRDVRVEVRLDGSIIIKNGGRK